MPSARFTPSLLDGETLEQLFVHRHHLVEDCVARIERAASSDERGARLLVGPRGAGKTHLISLVHHRALALDGFGTTFQLAWLPEDLWTVGSFEDLAKEIVRSIEPDVASTDSDPVDTIVSSSRAIGPIVVLIENLDQVFDEIGLDGQRQLRQLMENERSLLLIATSTRLGASVLDQAQPFYGFFDTTPLDPFDVDQAAEMLKQIAVHDGNPALAAELETPTARRRLAAVAHLAGGQPRVWALLSAGLTIERLDELVEALIDRFDDLTPYYQERLARLSVNERKVVRFLSDSDRSANVKQIAEAIGIEQRSLATTIGDLREKGWVKQRTGPLVDLADKRLRFYELAEPLARLAFQIKESRGKPIRLVVEFLKAWFDSEDLATYVPDRGGADPYVRLVRLEHDLDDTSEVHRALTRGRWEKRPPSPGGESALDSVLRRIDEGLADLATGDPSALLAEAPAISRVIEQQLTSGVSVEAIRLEVVALADSIGDPPEWLHRLDQILPHLTERLRRAALLSAASLRLRNLEPEIAALLVEEAADQAPLQSSGTEPARSPHPSEHSRSRRGWRLPLSPRSSTVRRR